MANESPPSLEKRITSRLSKDFPNYDQTSLLACVQKVMSMVKGLCIPDDAFIENFITGFMSPTSVIRLKKKRDSQELLPDTPQHAKKIRLVDLDSTVSSSTNDNIEQLSMECEEDTQNVREKSIVSVNASPVQPQENSVLPPPEETNAATCSNSTSEQDSGSVIILPSPPPLPPSGPITSIAQLLPPPGPLPPAPQPPEHPPPEQPPPPTTLAPIVPLRLSIPLPPPPAIPLPNAMPMPIVPSQRPGQFCNWRMASMSNAQPLFPPEQKYGMPLMCSGPIIAPMDNRPVWPPMMPRMPSPDSNMRYRMALQLPDHLVGHIFGPGGSIIKSIQIESKATIMIRGEQGDAERPIHMHGTKEQIDTAKSLMRQALSKTESGRKFLAEEDRKSILLTMK